MFSVSSEPVLLSEAGLHGLCVSLNTPVLNIDELPIGPARAGIVVFDGGYASLELAIAIRSVETRQVLLYSFQGRIGTKKTPAQALEIAASFAEGMGFLFDDDLVSSSKDGRSRAMRLWLDLTEVPTVSEVVELSEVRPRLSPAVPLEQPDEELFLEQSLELLSAETPDLADWHPEREDPPAEELWLEQPTRAAKSLAAESVVVEPTAAAPSKRVDVATPVPAPRVSLTKFRQPAMAAAPSARKPPKRVAPLAASAGQQPANGGSALGRVSLVRKRLGSDTGEPAQAKPSLLLRLLGSF